MKYFFSDCRKEDNTAIRKAPFDVAVIAKELGFSEFFVIGCGVQVKDGDCRLSVFLKFAMAKVKWAFISWRYYFQFKKGDVVLLQAPPPFFNRISGRKLLKRIHEKGVHFIYLIHDIGELREGAASAGLSRMLFDATVACCDLLIVHNDAMGAWLHARGVPSERIVSLGIFDYLFNGKAFVDDVCKRTEPEYLDFRNQVIVAGNMSAKKSRYLSGLKEIAGVRWKLYGPYYEESEIADDATDAVTYGGSYTPDVLPGKLCGAWGLVWDGDSLDTCSGPTGQYLRYNNPHKLSLYLASGIPVIIWSQAAEAQLVREKRLGICVDSLREIPAALVKVDSSAYANISHAVQEFSTELRTGANTRRALVQCLSTLQNGS